MSINNQDVRFLDQEGLVIWKSPIQSINNQTKIYSQMDHDIIFIKNGSFIGLFNDQQEYYSIDNDVSGFLAKLFGKKKDNELCDIYYINKIVELENKWGTPSKIDIYDKEYGIYTHVGASGSYRFSVFNPLKLFSKVKGVKVNLSQDFIRDFFRNEINTEIRNIIATFFLEYRLGIKDLALITTLEKKVSEHIFLKIKDVFSSYGLMLNRFLIHQFILDDEFISRINDIKKQSILDNLKQDHLFDQKIKEAKTNVNIDGVTREMNDHQREQDRKDQKLSIELNNKEDDHKVDNATDNYQKTQYKFCHHCGTKLKVEYRFCIQCGQKLL